MRHYELLLLVNPNQSEQLPDMLTRIQDQVKEAKGQVHRLEDWGRRKLAYAVKKNHKAHYVLLNIESSTDIMESIREGFRYNDLILRMLILTMREAVTISSPMAVIIQEEAKGKRSEAQGSLLKQVKNLRNFDYKDTALLSEFVMENGRIVPCRITSVTALQQRRITSAIKLARFVALMPYCDQHK